LIGHVGHPVDEGYRRLFEELNFGHVATLREDGRPAVRPTWVDIEGDLVVLDGNEERLWARDLRNDSRVTVTVADRNNPYFWGEVRGRVVEVSHEGALEHIHKLAKKYMDEYPFLEPGEQRVVLKIEAENVSSWNPTLLGPRARAYLGADE
jgi:PPOX class probable F420-dependent enzyme